MFLFRSFKSMPTNLNLVGEDFRSKTALPEREGLWTYVFVFILGTLKSLALQIYSKYEKLIGVQRRDSFDVRVCDDLCEEILQWLPFDEKIRLIDVSKQFNRCLKTLWMRQKVLNIGSNVINDRNDCRKFVTQKTLTNNSTKVLRFTQLLQTFPNITSIEFKGFNYLINSSEILDSITEYCNKLQSFRTDSKDFNSESMLNFALKFGPNIKTLEIIVGNISDLKTLIKGCTSLASLRIYGSSEVMFEFDGNSYNVLVNGLKKLSANFSSFRDFDKMIKNNQSLTHLDIGLKLLKPLEISAAFKKISELKELKYLKILLKDNDLYDPQMAKSFQLIAKNCINLKTFDFEFKEEKHFPAKDFFNGLFTEFSSLNKIRFYSLNHYNLSPKEYNLSIDCIKSYKQLTHLTLSSHNIPKEFFSSIDSVFPHLKHLSIGMKDKLTDNEMKSISRLKELTTLSISCGSFELKTITDSGMLSIINGCNHLYRLMFSHRISITEESINSIMQKAIENPGIYFEYRFDITDEIFFAIRPVLKKSHLTNIEIRII